jgi:hypothetical protein
MVPYLRDKKTIPTVSCNLNSIIFPLMPRSSKITISIMVSNHKMMIKLILIIIVGYHCYQHYKIVSVIFLTRINPYIDEITGDHQCGFRCNRSTTGQIRLHSSDAGEKMGVQRNSTSAIHRFQECLGFSEEGSAVQYSDRVWGTHEINHAN